MEIRLSEFNQDPKRSLTLPVHRRGWTRVRNKTWDPCGPTTTPLSFFHRVLSPYFLHRPTFDLRSFNCAILWRPVPSAMVYNGDRQEKLAPAAPRLDEPTPCGNINSVFSFRFFWLNFSKFGENLLNVWTEIRPVTFPLVADAAKIFAARQKGWVTNIDKTMWCWCNCLHFHACIYIYIFSSET